MGARELISWGVSLSPFEFYNSLDGVRMWVVFSGKQPPAGGTKNSEPTILQRNKSKKKDGKEKKFDKSDVFSIIISNWEFMR